MMTLEKFEEASEAVKKVILPTNLIYSEYYSAQTGGKVYLKPENIGYPGKSGERAFDGGKVRIIYRFE